MAYIYIYVCVCVCVCVCVVCIRHTQQHKGVQTNNRTNFYSWWESHYYFPSFVMKKLLGCRTDLEKTADSVWTPSKQISDLDSMTREI